MFSTRTILSIILSFATALLGFLVGTMPALAHAPHDHVRRLAISPDFTHDETIIAIVRRDLFVTNDAGNTWRRASARLPNRGYFSAVAFSSDGSAVAYVATQQGEVYASQDDGITWVEKSRSAGESGVNLLVVSPSDSNVLYAAGTRRNLYRSADMGGTWSLALNTRKRITSVTLSRNTKQQLLIAGDIEGSLYLLADGKKRDDVTTAASLSSAITAIEIPNLPLNEKTIFLLEQEMKAFIRLHWIMLTKFPCSQ